MSDPIDLYQNLPAFYRQEDARRGYPLKALLGLISEQANFIKEDIDRLWDNFFVETADGWVLPYLGDLVGNTPIHSVVRGRRADVAKTISYRLRKGTLPMLEELARDVTGWSVHAVPFFDILTWTQNMNHLRPNVGTIPVRDIDRCDRAHTPFDTASHTIDLRPFAPAAGWHHISKVGFFIWRLGSYELTDVQPHPAVGISYGYHFNPLGIPLPLFNSPQAESDETGLAGEIHIAQPIRRIAFHTAPELYFGPTGSLGIHLDGVEQTAADIVCMDLSTWQQRTDGKIGVDVVTGRFALPSGMPPPSQLDVSFHYGFSADVGGGSYERRDDETIHDPEFWAVRNPDEPGDVVYVPGDYDSIALALSNWVPATTPRLIIHLTDSRTHSDDLTLDQNTTNRENVQVIIQAANKTRPMLAGSLTIPASQCPARVSLKGVLVEGGITVAPDSSLDLLEVSHCTLVPGISLGEDLQPVQPGTPSLLVGANNDLLDVVIDHSITGPLRLPPDTRSLTVLNSLVDNMASTALGQVFPALVSGGLSIPDAAAAVGEPFTLRLGDETHTLRLSTIPNTFDEIAAGLEAAIRSVPGASEAFSRARVRRLTDTQRAIIIPGVPRPARVTESEAATLPSLTPGTARKLTVFIGAQAGDLNQLTAPPQMTVLLERVIEEALTITTFDITLPALPTTLTDVADDLQTILRARAELSAPDTFVRVDDGRLVVYSLETGVTLRFLPTPGDPLSVPLLGLLSSLPAIGYDAAGLVPGPESTIEESTIMGPVSVRAMLMGSNSIFSGVVTCRRRQIGCLRFSYVPPASITPQRYRCQPDRALEIAADQIRQQQLPPAEEAAAIAAAQTAVTRRVQPEFTTRRYGLPAYAQLSLDCAPEIQTGADNGAEMGVFNTLLQPQREANLHLRFEEYLPFGLEAGLIFVN